MHYRTAVAVLAVLAVGACSGDRALRPVTAKTVVHSTLWLIDSTGQRHEVTLPDWSMPQIFIKGRPRAIAPGGPQRDAPVTSSGQVTDSTGRVWTVTLTGYAGEPMTSATESADTVAYSQALTWATTDTGWALSVLTQTVRTPTMNGGSSDNVILLETMARPRLDRLLAFGERCATRAFALLEPPVAQASFLCLREFAVLLGATVAWGAALYDVGIEPFNPFAIMLYEIAVGLEADAWANYWACLNKWSQR